MENELHGLEFFIEHFRNTSIPELDSKSIIDIIYSKHLDFDKIRFGIEKLGYYHNENQGIKDREVFKRNNSLKINH